MKIQQVHWLLEMDYIGHPYYVSGNAMRHALGQQLPHEVHQHLHASHGIFVPGQFGTFPDWHSQSGSRPHLGSNLPPSSATPICSCYGGWHSRGCSTLGHEMC